MFPQGTSYLAFLLCNRLLLLPFMFNRLNLILPLVGICLTIALSNGVHAQQASTPPPAARISAENLSSFDPATATQEWLDTVPSDQRAKSDAYFEGGYWLIWGTTVPVRFLFTVTFIAPIYLETLFNSYDPLGYPAIRDPILAMARANEIPVK